MAAGAAAEPAAAAAAAPPAAIPLPTPTAVPILELVYLTHWSLHPSPLTLFPSSHYSPSCNFPFPQS